MDVRRVFHPHATWDAVMANIQGANLVYYAGHGYGWPSPYTKRADRSAPERRGPQHVRRQRLEHVHLLRRAACSAPTGCSPRTRSSSSTTAATPPATASRAWPSRPGTSPASASTTSPPASSQSVPRTVFAYSYQRFNKILTQLAHHDRQDDGGHVPDRRAPSPRRTGAGSARIRASSTPSARPAPRTSWTRAPRKASYRAVTGDLR